uniref:CSON005509 protein n=1 Tax=Culicoides sonorensis TaxID=179676 RepID=A0A336N367_CULSO
MNWNRDVLIVKLIQTLWMRINFKRIDPDNLKLLKKPADVWDYIQDTRKSFPINTTETYENEFISEIIFIDNQTFQEKSTSYFKSRHRVAITAMRTLLKIDHECWSRFFPLPDPKEVKRQNYIQMKIKSYQDCAEDYFRRARNSSQVTPLAVWNKVTQKYPMSTVELSTGKYLSKIIMFEEVITAEDEDVQTSRHKVAALAFEKLLSISHPCWIPYKDLKSAPRMTFQYEQRNQPMNHREEPDELQIFKHNARDFVRRVDKNDKNFTPLSAWNRATSQKYKITTISTPNGKYLSKVNCFNKLLTAEDSEEQRSRQKLAAIALEMFFDVSHPKWRIFKDVAPTFYPTQVLNTKSANETTKKFRSSLESITIFSNRARGILRDYDGPSDKIKPIHLWNAATCKKFPIKTTSTQGGYFSSTIDFYDKTLTASDSIEARSREKVAHIALKDILGIRLPYSSTEKAKPIQTPVKIERSPPSIESNFVLKEKDEVVQKLPEQKIRREKNSEIEKIEDEDEALNVDDTLLNELLKNPMPEKVKPSNDDIEEMLERLKKSARELLIENEGISPDQFWNLVTKNYQEYNFMTEFNSKSEKYESTIEFHEKTFTKADVDQHKSESMVACMALDELLGIEFNEGDEPSKLDNIKSDNEKNEEVCLEAFKKLEIDEEEEEGATCLDYEKSDIINERLSKRVEILLNFFSENNLNYSFENFIKLPIPQLLTENEKNFLNKILDNIFMVQNEDDESSDFMNSIIVNDYQVFGSGRTEKEAINAVIISLLEYIEEEELENDLDNIVLRKFLVKEDQEEEGTPETDEDWIEKLKELQKSLREEKKCLDDIPCSEIFSTIGFKFDFGYKDEDKPMMNPTLKNIKELSSRFILKKLLDAVYELED